MIIHVGVALVLAGCAIEGPPKRGPEVDDNVASEGEPSGTDFPAIDGNDKYFKPGPPLATTDEVEWQKRYDYHQAVIDAHGFSYTLSDSPNTRLELEQITGFAAPDDLGDQKPDKPKKKAWDLEVPERWDWREHGVGLAPAKQQGSCGSCWAFGSTAVVEAAVALFDQQIVNLSEQHVLDCSNKGSCNGGWWAYNIFKNDGGVYESDYPYKGYDQYCKSVQEHPYTIESYHSIQTGDIDAMKAAIYQYGAVGVTMSACGSFPGYGGGVYDSTECNWKNTNHIVTLVGWDDTIQHNAGSGAWVLRNSWGTNWGVEGYAMLAYGVARIEDDPTYVIYKPEDPTDTDEDGWTDLHDNCIDIVNPGQEDEDHDGLGDLCDDKFDPFEATLSLTDDDTHKLELGFSFPFYGTGYLDVHVNSDGNLTFGSPDTSTVTRDAKHFLTGPPRIAALYADLNPGASGTVTWGKPDPQTVFVRFDQVKRYDKNGTGTVTVWLSSEGDISLSYENVTGSNYVVGISKGGANNNAGQSNLGGTIAYQGTNAIYEVATGSFDLANQTVNFTPTDGSPPPPAETVLPLGDDDTESVPIGFDFPFFGQTHSTVHVNSDGNLTFGQGDDVSAARDKARFLNGVPRIAVLFRDLDPSTGGAITYEQTNATTLTIRYKAVRLYGKNSTASATATLHASGLVELTYGQVAGSTYIVGISEGASASGEEHPLGALEQPIGYGGTHTMFQQFGNPEPFDLASKTISFSTDGGVEPPPPPPEEHYLSLGDDDTELLQLGFSFPFFGQQYDAVYVNSDGNLTFGQGDKVSGPRDENRLLTGAPRIAVMFADLDPSSGGAISYHHADPSTIIISYTALPVWSAGGSNTARATLDASGGIVLQFDNITLDSAFAGVSPGGSGTTGSPLDLSAFMAGTWNYGGDGALYSLYDSNDPFDLNGTSVTFVP